jgi:hypothetical protein
MFDRTFEPVDDLFICLALGESFCESRSRKSEFAGLKVRIGVSQSARWRNLNVGTRRSGLAHTRSNVHGSIYHVSWSLHTLTNVSQMSFAHLCARSTCSEYQILLTCCNYGMRYMYGVLFACYQSNHTEVVGGETLALHSLSVMAHNDGIERLLRPLCMCIRVIDYEY